MQALARVARSLAIALSCTASLPAGAEEPQEQESSRWTALRTQLFQDRPIASGTSVVALEAPMRAADAALVPIAVQAQFPQSSSSRIQKMWLIIDSNPAPVAAVVRFGQASVRADFATRVRVDQYTQVRVVAETQDGKLHMASRHVKASGGCAAPPSKDAQAALATLGRTRLRVQTPPRPGEPLLAQLMISHPNHSGLAMDQLTRLYEPAYFVRSVEISHQGRSLLSADLDISISENPHLRFYVSAQQGGELRAEIVDSKEKRFEARLDLGTVSR